MAIEALKEYNHNVVSLVLSQAHRGENGYKNHSLEVSSFPGIPLRTELNDGFLERS